MWLTIETELLEPAAALLKLNGRIVTGRNSSELEWTIDKLAKERSLVVLEMAGVTHLDSTGIGILVMSAGKLKAMGGELRMASVSTAVSEVLQLTKVNEIVAMFPDSNAALAAPAGRSQHA